MEKTVIPLEAEMAPGIQLSYSRKTFWFFCLGNRSLEGNCGLSLLLISKKLKWCLCTSEAMLYSAITHPPTNDFHWYLCNTNQKDNWCWKISTESPLNHFKNSIHRYSSSCLWCFYTLKLASWKAIWNSHNSLSFYVNKQCYTVWYSFPWKYFRLLVPKINL